MEKKKVYFAASITGGTNPELCRAVIDKLKEKFIVLTEHFAVEDIHEYEVVRGHDEKYIYERDIKWIDECDFVFAEVTKVSTGVGYEIGYAESKGKKIICAVDMGQVDRLTAMLAGNENVSCHYYNGMDELIEFIDKLEI